MRNGDRIRLSVAQRSLSVALDDAEIARRAAQQKPTPPRTAPAAAPRGYRALFLKSVTQADEGCDFDFMRGALDKGSAPRR